MKKSVFHSQNRFEIWHEKSRVSGGESPAIAYAVLTPGAAVRFGFIA
ncbi:hypothetical protein [Coleofasciculus sp.]